MAAEVRCRRGDAAADERLDIGDGVYTHNHLFMAGSPVPTCLDATDSNDSGLVDLGDAVRRLNYLFAQGPALPSPGREVCGPDPHGG